MILEKSRIKIKKHKWLIHWITFSILISLFVFVALYFNDKSWIGNILQTVATITGIYLTIIIFLQSKEGSDEQYREHIEQLQLLNNRQIDALSENTKKQIETFQELTAKQIETLQISTEKQIEALQNSSSEQISSFEQQINLVTNKLSDNSILLAEILGRELEKAIETYENTLKKEKTKYNDLLNFKFLRSQVQREFQIKSQIERMDQIQKGFDYLFGKYKQLKSYLGEKPNKLIN